MATTDSGLPLFAQTDSADIATKLNAISNAVQDALDALIPDTGWVTGSGDDSSTIVGVSGVSTLGNWGLRRKNGVVEMRANITSLQDIPAGPSGNITNLLMATIKDSRFIPESAPTIPRAAAQTGSTGRVTAWNVIGSNDGDTTVTPGGIYLSAFGGTSNIAANDVLSAVGMWFAA